MLDDDTLRLYVDEAQEHLGGIEEALLHIEAAGADIDSDLVNQVFRAIHSVKGGAGFFGLNKIKDLGHDAENVLNMIRNRELVPTPDVANVLLQAADLLRQMVDDIAGSNDVDISTLQSSLQAISPQGGAQHKEAASAAAFATAEASQQESSALTVPQSKRREALLNEADLLDAIELYPHLYRIDIDVRQDLKAKDRSFKQFCTELEAVGSVLACSTDLQRGSEPRRGLISFVVGIAEDAPLVANVLQLQDDQLIVLHQEDQTTQPPALPEPSPSIKPVAAPAANAEAGSANKSTAADSKLRVSVSLLDQLMTLAGELVLTRNQMSLAIAGSDSGRTQQASQRLDQITSELQEAIVSTRMQPVGVVFTKFRRVVRDMARQLGKDIDLQIEGEEVELDKTIIEGLSDPLTHLVRNGIDHGIELPANRVASGKPAQATLSLRAFHEAGQVIIEVADDGAGIDPSKVKAKALEKGLRDATVLETMSDAELVKLIFLPGFSTASAVTDISGRGVGMDVVNTNLTQMGGVVDIASSVGKGTTIRIKLPLTLAIIPSLIIGLGEARYAIPQVNVQELVRVPAQDIARRVQRIGDAEVLRLRGELLPIVRLQEILRVQPVYRDMESGELRRDRRQMLADRRSLMTGSGDIAAEDSRSGLTDRRFKFGSAVNVVVVLAGSLRYGLVVDQLNDSEEIVVKPLDAHFQGKKIYAGATIQGDGSVAMILDVVELSRFVELDPSRADSIAAEKRQREVEGQRHGADRMSLLLVTSGRENQFAIPLPLITRIEKIERHQIEANGSRRSMIYRQGSLLLFTVDDVADVQPLELLDELYVVVFSVNQREVGLLVSSIEDTINLAVEFDRETFRQPGIFGSAIIRDKTTFLVDLRGVVESASPDWALVAPELVRPDEQTILVVEDSPFFLGHLQGFLEEQGFHVLTAMDGQEGLRQLEEHHERIDLVMTDIEMPVLDGFEFTRKIRKHDNYRHLPVIAVTSLAGDMDKARGFEAGVNEYLIKLDKEQILRSLDRHLAAKRQGLLT